MATFYIQLEDKLLQISGELTAENISKALGYVPVDSSTMSNYATKDEVSDLVDMSMVEELSQRVDNITFDSLKDNPFLQDGSGELNIVDEAGNIVAKIDVDGIHSVDFIAGEHRLSDKTDKTYVDEAVKNVKVDLTGYATEEYVNNIDFYNIKDNPIVNNGDGKLLFVDENGYIGLQLEEDGLYVKDVIADGHTLSQKADKSELSNYATKDEVSDLVDMSVVTELQGKVNTLIDTDVDKSVRDIAVDVLTETLVSETATEAYDTLAEMSAWIKSHPEDAAAMNTAIQKNATDIQSNSTAISNLDAAYKAADAKVLTDAQEYTDNINFYTIKDNPIVDGEAGSITFVDETGYIGLKVTEDGIIAKDVVTPEHTLSSKADKSFVEDNYYNKSTVDKKITEAVTGGQVSLDGFATEQWVNEQGFLKEHQDITHLAEKSELPTKTSDLTNDSGFITINDVPEVTVPTKVSELENDSKFITIDEVPEVVVPTKTSELTNDSGFITLSDVPVLEIPEEYVTETELNNKGFLTEHQDLSEYAKKDELPSVEGLASQNWVSAEIARAQLEGEDVDLSGYATKEDIANFVTKNELPSVDGLASTAYVDEAVAAIEIPSVEGFATEAWVNEQGFLTEHQDISHLANKDDIPSLDGYAKTSDIPSLDGYAKTEDLPNFDEFAKTEDIPSLDDYAKTEDIPSLDGYAKTSDIPSLTGYATETYVGEKIAEIEIPSLEGYAKTSWVTEYVTDVVTGGSVSLDGYATEEYVNNKDAAVQQWVNEKGYTTQEDIANIDFYSIKDNPIINNGDGKLVFADENGNIGLQLEADNTLYVKDVIAGDHVLSHKADKSELEGLATKKYVDDKFSSIEIPDVDFTGLATEQWVEDKNYLTEHQDISHLATKEEIPSLDGYAKTSDIPSLDGYAKTEDIPSLEEYATKQWVNNKNYATEDDLNNIEYSSINNVPVSEDETGELNITDESGNIGMKVASEAVYAKDFIAGEHKLSEKVDKTYVDNSITEAPTVKYVAQSLTSDQKLQARSNIGASDGSKSVVSLSGTRILIDNMEPYVVYAGGGIYNSVAINSVVTNSGGIQLSYAEYTLVFQTGTNCTLQLPNTIYWANGVIPSIEDNTIYELSISFSKCAGASTYRAVLTPFKRVS